MIKYLAAVLLSLCAFNSNAQLFDSYHLGVSFNATDINWDFEDDPRKYGHGFGLSISAVKHISDRFFISSSAELSNRSTRLDLGTIEERNIQGDVVGSFTPEMTRSTITLLSVPVTMGVQTVKGLYGYTGPRLDFKIASTNGETTMEYQVGTFVEEDRVYELADNISYGWSAGIGKSFSWLQRSFNAELRFNADLSRLIRDEGFVEIRKNSIDLWIKLAL